MSQYSAKPLRLVVPFSGGGTTLQNMIDLIDRGELPAEQKTVLDRYDAELEDLLGVGWHEVRVETALADKPPVAPEGQVEIVDLRGKYERCSRSWKRRPDVGSDPQYPDLSARDAAVIRKLMGK